MIATLFQMSRQRTLLWSCIAFSTALHLIGLITFYQHPLLLQSALSSLFGVHLRTDPISIPLTEEEIQEMKNKELAEAFDQVLILSSQFQKPYDLTQNGLTIGPNVEEVPTLTPGEKVLAKLTIDPVAAISPSLELPPEVKKRAFPIGEDVPFLPRIEIDKTPSITAVEPLRSAFKRDSFAPEELIETPPQAKMETQIGALPLLKQLEKIPEPASGTLSSFKAAHSYHAKVSDIPLQEKSDRKLSLYVSRGSTAPPETWEKRRPASTKTLAPIESYDLPKLASAAVWNDDFDLDVQVVARADEQGYYFSVALRPNFDISTHSLKQSISFVIDRSNSIEKHRFSVFKRAVLKALTMLQEGDQFNIYILDKKVCRLSEKNLPWSLKTIQAAESFLEKQEAGGLFTAADIYASLEKILPDLTTTDTVNTAILITDGNTLLSVPKQQKLFTDWMEKNIGKVALYTAATGQNNNLVLLDLLSSISGGKLLYSDTHASFPRKLAKLILDLRDPVASEMIVGILPSPDSKVDLFTTAGHVPNLYSHAPYVLTGSADRLSSFEIILQGRHHDQWIAIKKTISLADAPRGDPSLHRRCEGRQALVCYDKFLKEGKSKHLEDAKNYLKQIAAE